jgi:ABC-2 type transport system permease protein
VSGFEATRPAPTTGLAPPEWGGFDPSRASASRPGDVLRSFRTSTRLGWQMEANWTDPLLFFIYSVAKPVSSALILVFMLGVIGGAARPEYRAFVVVGSALWAFVLSGISGLAWTVLDDRERYRMLKYVYVSPSDFLVVLLGRGVARVAVGGMGAVITLLVGVVFLGVPFDVAQVNWPLLVVVMAAGLTSIIAIGVMLAAICLQTRQESWSYPEAVGGALFLVSGAIFPILVLPSVVQAAGLLTPLSWWIEGVRQALFPGGISSIGGTGSVFETVTGQATPDPAQIVIALLATGTVTTLLSIAVFRASDRRAKDRGLLDQTTGS